MADMKIIQLAKAGDLIITQDYGLASLLLKRRCVVIHHRAFMYNEKNIDRLLSQRYLSAKARRSGIRTKGPKAFTEEDRKKFIQFFTELIEKMLRSTLE